MSDKDWVRNKIHHQLNLFSVQIAEK